MAGAGWVYDGYSILKTGSEDMFMKEYDSLGGYRCIAIDAPLVGNPFFPESTADFFLGGLPYQVECFGPVASGGCGGSQILECPDPYLESDRGECGTCKMPCPSFIYETREYRTMWMVRCQTLHFLSPFSPASSHCKLTAEILLSKIYIVPGLVSIPLHVFVVASFWKLRYAKPGKKKPPKRILMLSLASLLYVALNVLPSTILFTDLACACETEDCMGETSACKTSRYTIFILMMIFYSLLTHVVRLACVIDIKHRANHFVRCYAKFGDRINWYMKTSNHICQNQLCFLGLFAEDDLD